MVRSRLTCEQLGGQSPDLYSTLYSNERKAFLLDDNTLECDDMMSFDTQEYG